MSDATERAEELTVKLLEWLRSERPMAAIPALLVAAAKIAVASGEDEERLGQMIAVLNVAFSEEREKRDGPLF